MVYPMEFIRHVSCIAQHHVESLWAKFLLQIAFISWVVLATYASKNFNLFIFIKLLLILLFALNIQNANINHRTVVITER